MLALGLSPFELPQLCLSSSSSPPLSTIALVTDVHFLGCCALCFVVELEEEEEEEFTDFLSE